MTPYVLGVCLWRTPLVHSHSPWGLEHEAPYHRPVRPNSTGYTGSPQQQCQTGTTGSTTGSTPY